MTTNLLSAPVGVEWKRIPGFLGPKEVFYELPRVAVRRDPLDLHEAEFVNIGFISKRLHLNVWPANEGRLWMACFRQMYHGDTLIFPLCLEIIYSPPGSITDWLVKTPPGRRGWNATILFNQQGKLVSKVLFGKGAVLRLIFLNEKLNDLNWHSWDALNSAVALHVIEPHLDI